MGFPEKLNTRLIEASCKLKALPYVPKLLSDKSTFTLMPLLDEHALKRPNSTAIKYQDAVINWQQLQFLVNRNALVLQQLGVKKDTKVVILLDNRPEYLINLLALSRLQAVGVLINTSVVGKSLAHCMNSAEVTLCLAGEEHIAKIDSVLDQLEHLNSENVLTVADEESDQPPSTTQSYASFTELTQQCRNTLEPAKQNLAPSKAKDICCYIYTSGTTGLPKPAIVKYQRILAGGVMSGKAMMQLSEEDTVYIPTPLFHSVGMAIGVGGCMITGASMALRRGFSATGFWDDIRRYNATAFTYVGELCRYIVNQPPKANDKDHPLRTIMGVGLRPDVWRNFIERFGDIKVNEFYGATEGSALICNFTGKVGMLGRAESVHKVIRCDLTSGDPIRNNNGFYEEVSVGETGLLIIHITARSPFDGYIDKKASDTKRLRDVFEKDDLYFNTGDLVNLHEDKWMSFADRVGDTYRWKGENVSTNEVAEILNGCQGVLEANVYGVEVPGNEGKAGMASLNVNDDFDIANIEEVISEELAHHQRPYFLRLQQDMRITQTFKHQKVDYQKEGFDPNLITDNLFLLQKGQYQKLDIDLYNQICNKKVDIK